MPNNHSIQTFVHRILVFRLIAATLFLSLLIGLSALYIEQNRVSQEIIDITVGRLSVFSERYSHLLSSPDYLDPKKIHQAMTEFGSTKKPDKLGSFVFIGVYDVYGKAISEIFNDQQTNFDKVKKRLREMGAKVSGQKDNQYEIIRTAGRPYLRITLPVTNKNTDTVGIIDSIFAFSPETITSFRSRGLRAMISAIIIVFLTTLILYPVILRLTRRITRFSMKLLDANLDTLETLGSAIALRDSDTNAHNYRVTIYVTRIGEELGLPNQTMRALIKGSFLHDVGKIGIPDEILLKPGKLSEKEFEIMKTHVDKGRDIIQRSKWLHDALGVVLYHHEKVVGKGYTIGLTGENIPLTARIFAIADVFDALTSKRPYKEAWSFNKAIEVLEDQRGTHFDPHLLDAFIRIAKPLYDKFGGKEEIFREELGEIITKYFHEGVESLEY